MAAPVFDYCVEPPPALLCPICRDVLEDPVVTPHCQHTYCRACLARALALSPTCPVDRSPLPALALCPPAPRLVQQLLDDLLVKCTTCQGAAVRREQWAAHLAAHHHPDHSSVDPDPGPVTIPDDDDPNPATPVPCAHCTEPLPLPSHPSHLLHTCPAVPLPCPHAPHGCPYTGPRTHLHTDHLPAECAYEPLREYLARQHARTVELEAENWELRARVASLDEKLGQVTELVDRLGAALGEYAPTVVGPTTTQARPRSPTPRRRRPASSPPPFEEEPSATLPTTLAVLQKTTTAHTTQLATLAHAHTQHAQLVADELAHLHAQLGGVIQWQHHHQGVQCAGMGPPGGGGWAPGGVPPGWTTNPGGPSLGRPGIRRFGAAAPTVGGLSLPLSSPPLETAGADPPDDDGDERLAHASVGPSSLPPPLLRPPFPSTPYLRGGPLLPMPMMTTGPGIVRRHPDRGNPHFLPHSYQGPLAGGVNQGAPQRGGAADHRLSTATSSATATVTAAGRGPAHVALAGGARAIKL